MPDMQNICNAPYFTAHRATFHNTLLGEAIRGGVLVKLGCLVTKIDFSEASVYLANGDIYQGDLVLGTDGENSQCRELMLGRPDPPYHYGDMIFGLDIRQEEICKHDDLRDIVDPPSVHFWLGPGTHCVGFSLKENDMFHIIGDLPDSVTNKIQARLGWGVSVRHARHARHDLQLATVLRAKHGSIPGWKRESYTT